MPNALGFETYRFTEKLTVFILLVQLIRKNYSGGKMAAVHFHLDMFVAR